MQQVVICLLQHDADAPVQMAATECCIGYTSSQTLVPVVWHFACALTIMHECMQHRLNASCKYLCRDIASACSS